MGTLMRKQGVFMRYAFGGAPEFSGRSLVEAHKHLLRDKGLNLEHFDAVVGHFVAVLQQLSVPEPLIQEAAAILLSTRPLFDPANMDASSA